MHGKGLVDIGAGNMILISRIIAVADASQPHMQEKIEMATENGHLYDCCNGHQARSMIIMDDQSLILSSLNGKTLASRISRQMLQEVVLEI